MCLRHGGKLFMFIVETCHMHQLSSDDTANDNYSRSWNVSVETIAFQRGPIMKLVALVWLS